jgi:acetyltransferase-like isoleucine patch superfamily enzyme
VEVVTADLYIFPTEVVVVGAGGHGRDVAQNLGDSCKFVGFYDDDPEAAVGPVLGNLHEWLGDDRRFIIGINDVRERRRLAEWYSREGGKGTAISGSGMWVHPQATGGAGTTYCPHVHVNAGAFCVRSYLGSYSSIGPNATICGDVTIGNLVTIGAGATVCEWCVIGDGATIGAGAVLPPHTIVPAGETWVSPAVKAVAR